MSRIHLIVVVTWLLSFQSAVCQERTENLSVQSSLAIATEYTPLKEKKGPHPDFILPSIDGKNTIQLSDYRGKKVLLLHFASW